MNKLEELKALLAQAGKWPERTLVGEGEGHHECPTCGGDGTVSPDFVRDHHAGCVGVQVYGIGDEMAAMEKLLPLLFTDYLPGLIAAAEAAKKVDWPNVCLKNYEERILVNVLQDALLSLTKGTDK